MKELEVQKFLRSGKSLENLKEIFKIDFKFHKFFPELVLLKYNQIESPMNKKIVQECRGLILNTNNNYEVINYTFDKFFNFGESNAAKVNWKTSKVGVKYDGSLIQIYWYNNQWNVATSGCPDGENFVGDFGISFKDLFFNTLKNMNLSMPNESNKNYCFAVELCTSYNKIVVQHKNAYIKLLSARNVNNFEEVKREDLKNIWDVPIYEVFSFSSVNEINKSFEEICPVEMEGFVVVDDQFNRIKIKHPGYVALHQIKSSNSLNNFVSIIKNGEIDEVVSYFPEYREILIRLKSKIDFLIYSLEEFWQSCKDIKNRKEFALAVNCHPISSVFFSMKDGKVNSVSEFIKKMDNDKLLRVIGEKNESKIN